MTQKDNKPELCSRCYECTGRYPVESEDENGDKTTVLICEDCNWDLMNGGSMDEEAYDVVMKRWENDYSYDPVNTPPPPGYV